MVLRQWITERKNWQGTSSPISRAGAIESGNVVQSSSLAISKPLPLNAYGVAPYLPITVRGEGTHRIAGPDLCPLLGGRSSFVATGRQVPTIAS
jgi:hypothetical protein